MGINNAGKSNILNGIIGIKISLSQKNECMKKGVSTKHWGKYYLVIRKTRFISEIMGKDKIYCFEHDEDIIAKGIKNIHRILEGTDSEFTSKEQDFFMKLI